MVEVKDEILESEPLYRISDKNGNIINDDVKIEMITRILQEGTPLNKALFDIAVPTGLICMWSGSEIPKGWYLCDGTNGTPDLRDRFIVGAGSEYSVGATGGEKEHTLTIEEMPSHSHSLGSANVSKTFKAGQSSAYSGTYPLIDENGNNGNATINMGEHTHTIGNTGGGQPHENRPPYYALAFIMKA